MELSTILILLAVEKVWSNSISVNSVDSCWPLKQGNQARIHGYRASPPKQTHPAVEAGAYAARKYELTDATLRTPNGWKHSKFALHVNYFDDYLTTTDQSILQVSF